MTSEELEDTARFMVDKLKELPGGGDREEVLYFIRQAICMWCGSLDGSRCCCERDD